MSQTERVRNPDSWQWSGWQVTSLAYGAIGAKDCGRGAPVYRGLLSQYQLPAQQE